MENPVIRQAAKILPPREGAEVVLAVDATSRQWDLWAIAFGTPAVNTNASNTGTEAHAGVQFFVTMYADGGAVYYAFSPDGMTVDDTAATATGAAPTPAFVANGCHKIAQDSEAQVYVNRGKDRFLVIKCAAGGSAKLRIRVSSDRSDNVTASAT